MSGVLEGDAQMNFTSEQVDILRGVALQRAEIFSDIRKGVPQTKYVFEVEHGEYFSSVTYNYEKIPHDLVGFWMMRWEGDLTQIHLLESIKDDVWVKCEQKEIVTYEWVEL